MFRIIITILAIVGMQAHIIPTTVIPETVLPHCSTFLDEFRETHVENFLYLWGTNYLCQSCGTIMYIMEELYNRPFVREGLRREFGNIAGIACFVRFG